MRARHGLALTLLKLGEEGPAIEHFQAMLELNPGDNQGIRYLLLGSLLRRDDIPALKALLADSPAAVTSPSVVLTRRPSTCANAAPLGGRYPEPSTGLQQPWSPNAQPSAAPAKQPTDHARLAYGFEQIARQPGGASSADDKPVLFATSRPPKCRNGRHVRKSAKVVGTQTEYGGVLLRVDVLGRFSRTPRIEACVAAEHLPNVRDTRCASHFRRCRPASRADGKRIGYHRATHVLRPLISGSNFARHASVCSGVSSTSP